MNLFNNLKNQCITDIQQVGVVDIENGIGEITTFHTYLYIRFADTLLKLESTNQYSKLLISIVPEIDFQFSFEIDEDMIPVKHSIAEIVLTDTMADNRITKIDVYGGEETNNGLICDALSFCLVHGQELFFDPTYFFGINIGDERQRNAWMQNYPNTAELIIPKETIRLMID